MDYCACCIFHGRGYYQFCHYMDAIVQSLTSKCKKGVLSNTQYVKESNLPFNAMTLLAGFMMAESAEIGLLMGLVGSDMSMITTWAVSPTFSRTQMYLELKTMHTIVNF